MAASSVPGVVEMLRELVGLPSCSAADPRFDCSNRPVIDRLASWAEDLGFRVGIHDVPGTEGRKANMVATLGDGEGGLVLAGHTDTVPYDERGWSFAPLELTELDGNLYGLGAADTKASLAVALEAARELDASRLREPLTLVATADEESTMAGARALVQRGQPRARAAVVGEPTSLQPVRKHKGILMEAIRLTGTWGHSSDPKLGVSALEGMHEVIGELIAWREELQHVYRDEAFAVPVPTLNLGRIEGGDNPNRICGACELGLDLRPIPGMELDATRRELRDRVHRCLEGSEIWADFEALFDGIPPFETDARAPLVVEAERLTSTPARAVMFGTESPFFAQLGMDTIVLGPGDIRVAHQRDEHVPAASLEPAVRVYRELARRFCVEAGGAR